VNDVSKGQLIRSAAEVYDTFFVPALFGEWGPRMADAAGLTPGRSVLDVACGTGVFAREALARVQPGGSVTGFDRNEDMLAVARQKAPAIDWQSGIAEALPFADHQFDVVACQFALMFFEDRQAALQQMWRVLRPGGCLVAAVWDALERTPGYTAVVNLLRRLFGEEIANELRAPFILGDTGQLRALFADAGINDVDVRTITGSANFPSIDDWVHTDIKGWTLADRIDDAQYELLRREAHTELARFARPDGSVSFDSPAHIVIARKPS
jgi:ubiquinone/menaquinone biosynthesis C-methylase UbiE